MKRVTIHDVAKRAGVSTGTVSAVLNERPNVRDQTRRRVLKAIDEMGYQPSPSARILRAGRNNGQVLEKGVGLLIHQLETAEPVPPKRIRLDVELMVRGSTRPLTS